MKLPRRNRGLPKLPPAPRLDPKGRRLEIELFTEAFSETPWRRPTPL